MEEGEIVLHKEQVKSMVKRGRREHITWFSFLSRILADWEVFLGQSTAYSLTCLSCKKQNKTQLHKWSCLRSR